MMGGQELPHVDETQTQQTNTQYARISVQPINNNPQHPKYGNMLVFLHRGNFIISLGPDYACFIPTFIFLCILSFLMSSTVNQSYSNQYVKIFALLLGILQCGSYLLVALSNPGICLPQTEQQIEESEEKVKKCKKCGVSVKRRRYHCRECDVCVDGYDHHCPWTSKCIGKGNLWKFYLFITVTPIYFICLMILMMGALILSAEEAMHKGKASS